MTCVEMVDALIAKLEAAKEDAAKVDAGKAGAAGTRLRKVASEGQDGLGDIRRKVIELRKPEQA